MMTDPSGSEPKPAQTESLPHSVAGPAKETAPAPKPAPGMGGEGQLFFPAPGQGSMTVESEKNWASLGHILSLIGIATAGIGYVVGPLVIYLLKKGQSPFVDEHTKETLNFSIVTALAIWVSTVGAVASFPVIGCFAPLVPVAFAVLNLIYCIQGFSAARNGQAYRYPFNWRMIK